MNGNSGRITPTAIGAAVLISVVLFFLFFSVNLKGSSAYFPTFTLGLILILSMVLIVKEVFVRKPADPDAKKGEPWSKTLTLQIALSIVLMFAYIPLMNWVGFYTTTLIYVPIVSYIYGYRDIKRVIIGTVVYTGLLYIIFSQLMGREMPSGILL